MINYFLTYEKRIIEINIWICWVTLNEILLQSRKKYYQRVKTKPAYNCIFSTFMLFTFRWNIFRINFLNQNHAFRFFYLQKEFGVLLYVLPTITSHGGQQQWRYICLYTKSYVIFLLFLFFWIDIKLNFYNAVFNEHFRQYHIYKNRLITWIGGMEVACVG